MKKKHTKIINMNNKENHNKGRTNWKKLKSLSEKDIQKNALNDEHSYIPSEKELKQFKRVNPVDSIIVKLIRKSLGLSQQTFSLYFGFSVRTIQEWEQGRRKPAGAIRNFLKVISYNPKAVQDALLDEEQS